MSDTKQTAVQYLMQRYHLTQEDFEQALAMEREQIESAYLQGDRDSNEESFGSPREFNEVTYFDKTYGNK